VSDTIETILAENAALHMVNTSLRQIIEKLDTDNVALRIACMAMILSNGGTLTIPSNTMLELSAQIGHLTIGVEQTERDKPYGVTYQLVTHTLDKRELQ
jgi:hypothetical protein